MKITRYIPILFLFLSSAALAEKVTLRVHHFLPSTAFPHSEMVGGWCDRVEKESEGDIRCRIYPAMQLGGTPAQLINQARDGIVDAVFTVPTYQPGAFVKTEVFELPFIAGNAIVGAQAMWDYIQAHAMDEYRGVRPVWVTTGDHSLLHFGSNSVSSLEDMRGLRIRSASRFGGMALEALGALPIQMPASAVTESISRGVLEGAMLPWSALRMVNMHEVTTHHTDFAPHQAKLTNSLAVFVMNQKKYDALPDRLKRIIDNNSGVEASAIAGRIYDDYMDRDLAFARERGDEINVLTDAEYQRWVDATSSVRDAWIREVGSRSDSDPSALLRAAEALVEKYTAQEQAGSGESAE